MKCQGDMREQRTDNLENSHTTIYQCASCGHIGKVAYGTEKHRTIIRGVVRKETPKLKQMKDELR